MFPAISSCYNKIIRIKKHRNYQNSKQQNKITKSSTMQSIESQSTIKLNPPGIPYEIGGDSCDNDWDNVSQISCTTHRYTQSILTINDSDDLKIELKKYSSSKSNYSYQHWAAREIRCNSKNLLGTCRYEDYDDIQNDTETISEFTRVSL